MGKQGQLRDKPFRDALRKAILRTDGDAKRLDKIAVALLNKAQAGDVAAIREIMDRVDGKVPQGVGGDSELGPIGVIVTGVPRAGDA